MVSDLSHMALDSDDVEQHAAELYGGVAARSLFSTHEVSEDTRKIQVDTTYYDEISMADFDPSVPLNPRTKQRKVQVSVMGTVLLDSAVDVNGDPTSFGNFDDRFRSDVARVIRSEIRSQTDPVGLVCDSVASIVDNVADEGIIEVAGDSLNAPNTLIVSEEIAEHALEASEYSEWDTLKEDISNTYLLDVHVDECNVLMGHEAIVADTRIFGQELHAFGPRASDSSRNISCSVGSAYIVMDPGAAVRFQINV